MRAHPEVDAGSDAGLRRGADHIAPDCAGQDFYAIDRGLRDLLAPYLPPDDSRAWSRISTGSARSPAAGSTSWRGSPTSTRRCCTRATASAATRTGSTTTPPTARWSRSRSAISSSTP